jgi:hypothetical protein
VTPQYYSGAAHMLRVLRKGGEHFVFRICSSLRVTGFVLADYLDAHGLHRFKRPGRYSTPPMFSGMKDTVLSSIEARARPQAARRADAKNRELSADGLSYAGQERFVQKGTASE